jgi:hypothetical protein
MTLVGAMTRVVAMMTERSMLRRSWRRGRKKRRRG